MVEIPIKADSTIENQLDFLKRFPFFPENAVYGFLFENLTLREVESKYLGIDGEGFFAKSVLNALGIDTCNKCRGVLVNQDLKMTSDAMVTDKDQRINMIGVLLNNLWIKSKH